MYTISSHLEIQGNTVLLIGNRSYKNLGDELILIGTIKLLQQQQKTIYIQAYDPQRLKHFLKQFIAIDKIIFLHEFPKGIRSLLRFLRKGWQEIPLYRKIKSVVVGGGEILTEENPNSYRYRLLSLLPLLIKRWFVKVPIYLMGGIQIPKKHLNKKLFSYLLDRTDHIYARDYETIDELTAYGYPHATFFMDTAYFAWDWQKTINKAQHHPSALSSPKYIIVNLNANGEQFLETMVADLQTYIRQGYCVYYVPVAKGNAFEYLDKYYYFAIKDKLVALDLLSRNIHFELLDWEHDIATFLDVVQGAEIVISTRLHLFLIASFLGVKTKVYPYQKKILKMQKVLKKMEGED